MAANSFAGGLAAGLGPAFQAQMYAKALRNAGIGKEGAGDSGWTDTTGQGAGTVPPSASWWQRNMPTWLGGAEPSGSAAPDPNAGNYLQGFQAYMPTAAPASTGTTQGHPAARRPMFTPPPYVPPPSPITGFGAGVPSPPPTPVPAMSPQSAAAAQPIWPQSPIAQQGPGPYGLLNRPRAPFPWSPVPVAGGGSMLYQPGSAQYGYFPGLTG